MYVFIQMKAVTYVSRRIIVSYFILCFAHQSHTINIPFAHHSHTAKIPHEYHTHNTCNPHPPHTYQMHTHKHHSLSSHTSSHFKCISQDAVKFIYLTWTHHDSNYFSSLGWKTIWLSLKVLTTVWIKEVDPLCDIWTKNTTSERTDNGVQLASLDEYHLTICSCNINSTEKRK